LSDSNDMSQLRRTVDALSILAGGLAITLDEVVGEHGGAAITYKLGANAGRKIADRMRRLEKPEDAMTKLFCETKGIYDTKMGEMRNLQDGEPSGVLEIKGCFIREVAKKQGLKIGGTLCRITRGYYETALARMTGKKVNIRLIDGSDNVCHSSVCFESSGQKK
jgi:predicted hydrocarbon binding protein